MFDTFYSANKREIKFFTGAAARKQHPFLINIAELAAVDGCNRFALNNVHC